MTEAVQVCNRVEASIRVSSHLVLEGFETGEDLVDSASTIRTGKEYFVIAVIWGLLLRKENGAWR